jgi:hypothetical protein
MTNPTNDELKAVIAAAEWKDRHGYLRSEFEAEFNDDEAAYIARAANHADAMARELLAARAALEAKDAELGAAREVIASYHRYVNSGEKEPLWREFVQNAFDYLGEQGAKR